MLVNITMQESILQIEFMNKRFLTEKGELLELVCIKCKNLYDPQYTSDRSVKSQLSCTIRKRTTASD